MRISRTSIIILILLLVGSHRLPAFASERPVVILVGADITPYREAEKGVREALSGERTVTYTLEENPDRIFHTMAKVSLLSPRGVIAIGSQAALALKASPVNAPVVFSLLVDHEEGLEIPQSWGISMHPDPREAYEKIRMILPRRRIGIPYNPERTGRIVEALLAYFKETPIQLVPMIVREPAGITPAFQRERHRFDAIWLLPDGSFIDPLSVRAIIDYSISERLPILGFSEALAKNGAVLSVAGDYEEMGRQAAETLQRVLSGKRPPRIQPPRRLTTFVNIRVSRILNLPVGETVIASAGRIYPADPQLRDP